MEAVKNAGLMKNEAEESPRRRSNSEKPSTKAATLASMVHPNILASKHAHQVTAPTRKLVFNPTLPGLGTDSAGIWVRGEHRLNAYWPLFPLLGLRLFRWEPHPLQLKCPADAEDKTRQESWSEEATSTHMPVTEHGTETATVWSGATLRADSCGSKTQTETHLL